MPKEGASCKSVLLVSWGLVLAAATGPNGSSILDNPDIAPAYIDWDLGIMLTEAKDYTGYTSTKNYIGYTDSKVITTWQESYLQKSRYQAYQLKNKTAPYNSTVTIEVSSTLPGTGKWRYHSVTHCNALMNRPSLNFVPVSSAGSGLMPVTCGIVRPDSQSDYIHCNVVYRQSCIQMYSGDSENGTTTPIQTLDRHVMDLRCIDGVYSPVLRDALAPDTGLLFEKEQLNMSRIGGVYIPKAGHLSSVQPKITLNSLQNISTGAMCPDDTIRLVLPIGGLLMNGALLYCFDFEGEILVTTKRNLGKASPGVMSLANCSRALDNGRLKLVLYDGSDQRADTRLPIQYLYSMNMTEDGWSITCTSMYYQVGGYVDWNGWAQEYFSISTKDLWGYVNNCTTGSFSGPLQTVNDKSLQYKVRVGAGFIKVTAGNGYGGPAGGFGSNILLYPYPDWDSIGALEREEEALQIMKMTTSSNGTWCLLNLAYDSSGPRGNFEYSPWDAVVANDTISDLVQLGVNSGYGVSNVPTIEQLKNEIKAQFLAYTLSASMSAAMTGVVAACSASVFTLKIGFLKSTNNTRLAIRIVISIIEAALADIAVITYMVGLSKKGRACKEAQWYNTRMSSIGDINGINKYVYTAAYIEGEAEYLAAQWAILAVASAIVVTLIMYRWHFSKGGTRSDWIEIVREGKEYEQKETAAECSKHTEVPLPIVEEAHVYKRPLRTIRSAPDKTREANV